mgnify:CR=1 FL=1|jgi:hypothetical protein
MKIKLTLFAFMLGMASCTQNEMAKSFGGKAIYTLPKGEKLVNVTWKEDHLWYLTKPMTANDTPETYTFKEKSSFGIIEGSVTLIETK